MSERNGVEIDYCQKCRGVWLDRGELDKIIERAAVRAPRERDDDEAEGFGSPYPPGASEGNRYGRQQENPIADLFDFF